MEICQHCGMYMKPFFSRQTDASEGEASCEFCGKTIAKLVNGKWVKIFKVNAKDWEGVTGSKGTA